MMASENRPRHQASECSPTLLGPRLSRASQCPPRTHASRVKKNQMAAAPKSAANDIPPRPPCGAVSPRASQYGLIGYMVDLYEFPKTKNRTQGDESCLLSPQKTVRRFTTRTGE